MRGRSFRATVQGRAVRRRLSTGRAREVARQVAAELPARPWRRLLHVSDHHNLPSGFRLALAVEDEVEPDVVVNTGDVSGWGPVTESLILWRYLRIERPYVFAPGNHDSSALAANVRAAGGSVFEEAHSEDVAGIRFWGFRDPNRTHLFGPPYRPDLCLAAAKQISPPAGPLIAVVHNELMVDPPESVSMVLCGHFHAAKLRSKSGVPYVRSGSIGGAGPLRKLPLQFAIVDIAPGMVLSGVFFVEVNAGGTSIQRAVL